MRSEHQDGRQSPASPRRDALAVALILAATGLIHLPGLNHPFIPDWDEAMHQAAARGTYDSWLRPHLYADPLLPSGTGGDMAIHGDVWLHMPTGPLWLAALLMHVVGVIPAALRLVSVLADLAVALALYFLARPLTNRVFALLGSLLYLALPFLWRMTQGWQFGDATDTTLAAFVTLALLCLMRSSDRKSMGWAAAAGAAVGAAFLCKSGLGLAPLGVAILLAFFQSVRLVRGLRWRDVFCTLLGAAVVAVPWNLYCAHEYPDVFRVEWQHAIGHLAARVPDLSQWKRPWDAVFNGVHDDELRPVPVALPLFALLWLVVRAIRRRETRVVALALWLAGSWAAYTRVTAKAPGLAWGAIPGAIMAIAILCHDAADSWALLFALLGTLGTGWIVEHAHFVTRLREALPSVFEDSRSRAGLVEGLFAACCGAVAGLLIDLVPWFRWRRVRLGLIAGAAALAAVSITSAQRDQRVDFEKQEFGSYAAEAGPVLATLPRRSVLVSNANHDPEFTFLHLDFMFWTGLMTYVNPPPEIEQAEREKGYHPYLISVASEPYVPVPGIPAQSWTRAYDMSQPTLPPALPEGVEALRKTVAGLKVLGFAAGRIDRSHDRYAVFASGDPDKLRLVFHLNDGRVIAAVTGDVLVDAAVLRKRNWFILPVIGPPRAQVGSIEVQKG